MNISQIIKSRRTIRQFQQKEIPKEILEECVDAGRLAPSAMNRQPLEYIVVNNEDVREQVFKTLGWGGKLSQEQLEKHQPKAYIIVLVNKQINPDCDFDVGLAVENIVLLAWSKGVVSCILGAIDKEKIKNICQVPDNFEIKLVIALGYPAEKSIIGEIEDNDKTTSYWRDENNVLHVPKRKLENIIHFDKF